MKTRKIHNPRHLKPSYLPKTRVSESYNQPVLKRYKLKSFFIGLFVLAAYVSIIDVNQEKKK